MKKALLYLSFMLSGLAQAESLLLPSQAELQAISEADYQSYRAQIERQMEDAHARDQQDLIKGGDKAVDTHQKAGQGKGQGKTKGKGNPSGYGQGYGSRQGHSGKQRGR